MLIGLNKKEKLPFRFTGIGNWWKKGEEIDLIAFNKETREALFCEVKWKDLSEKEASSVICRLQAKSENVRGNWKKYYCVIARKIEGKADMDHLVLDLDDIADMV